MGEVNNFTGLNINQQKELRSQLNRKDIKTVLIGKISKRVERAAVDTVLGVFKKMKFNGLPPKEIVISEGPIMLPEGGKALACYDFDTPPGTIRLSLELSRAEFEGPDRIPDEIAVAACAAHEAVEHVNVMKGKKTLSSRSAIPLEIHAATKSEKEANKIAREVLEEKYGWKVYFGEELYLQDKNS